MERLKKSAQKDFVQGPKVQKTFQLSSRTLLKYSLMPLQGL